MFPLALLNGGAPKVCDPYYASVLSLVQMQPDTHPDANGYIKDTAANGAYVSATYPDGAYGLWYGVGGLVANTHWAGNAFQISLPSWKSLEMHNWLEIYRTGFSATDWTLEWWCNISNTGTIQTLFYRGSSTEPISSFEILANGTISYSTYHLLTFASKESIVSTGTFTFGEWVHVAIVQEGAATRIYVGGVLLASGAITRFGVTAYNYAVIYGRKFGTTSNQTTGLFDEIRLTTVARYTDNFTPPTERFPDC